MSRYLEVVFSIPVRKSFSYLLPEELEADVGCRVEAPFGPRVLTGAVVGVASAAPPGVAEIRPILRSLDSRPLFREETLKLARWISRMYLCSLGEALIAMLPGARREREMVELPAEPEPGAEAFKLSTEQEEAVASITAAGKGFYYLQGVTGSGKTEVFLRVAEHALGRGRGVIYLVPEISLTHQAVELFRARFGEQVAVMHSSLTPSQRLREWGRVVEGKSRLVIGARSAVFAPVVDLGLIVLDEEHEGSYKSSSTPRYHARQVAMHRCTHEGAILVMGSATPSLEAYYHMESGRLRRFILSRRLSGGASPRVLVQDLKGESSPLSQSLVEEIKQARAEGRQSILFLNRRGFSTFFHCRSCGYIMTCRRCSVSLTYHKGENRLICHYCGSREEPRAVCPECGSLDVGYAGFGTERIEEEVARLFPDLRISRLDTDAVRRRGVLGETLAAFKRGEIDLLLGTQMVAKGLNFPGVKLVGIVSADTGLQLPDFRAAERTFALIVQVSGRAGRFHPDGTVVVQTLRPEHETIRLAAEGKLDEFYRRELESRRLLGFPPYTRIIRVVFRGRSRRRAQQAADLFLARFQEAGGSSTVLGPADCPLATIAGNHRVHLLFLSREFKAVHREVQRACEGFKPPAGVYPEVDVDPVSLL